jgi:hypothetical protein
VSTPQLTKQFLRHTAALFERRRRSLTYVGSLTLEASCESGTEVLTVIHKRFNFPALVLQLCENHKLSCWLKSNRRATRGKILFQMHDIVVVDTDAIVRAFELTTSEGPDFADGVTPSQLMKLKRRWSSLSLRQGE